MPTMFDYLDWRGDLTFDNYPLCNVDLAVLSMISYTNFDKIVQGFQNEAPPMLLKDAAQTYYKRWKHGDNLDAVTINTPFAFPVFKKAPHTKRFGKILLVGYESVIDTKKSMQFSAVTFICENNKRHGIVTYRGTDHSLVGWEEDCNMAFTFPVNGQLAALDYLKTAASYFDTLTVCGHSKGGNFAVYAAAAAPAEIQAKITEVYNFDGPGFEGSMMESEGYLEIADRIHTYLPEGSVIGLLLNHTDNFMTVKSRAFGLEQHECPKWEVMGADFVYADGLTDESKLIEKTVRKWIDGMTPIERKQLVGSLFELLSSHDTKTVPDLGKNAFKIILASLSNMKTNGAELRRRLWDLISEFGSAAIKDLFEAAKLDKNKKSNS